MNKKRRPQGKLPRTRIRYVDLSRVEHARGGETLSPFEILVQRELGASPSPSDVMIREEEEKELDDREALCKQVLQKLRLTERQKQCFECVMTQRISIYETAELLGIGRETVRSALKDITNKLSKAIERFQQGKILKLNPHFRFLTPHERELFKLYWEELLGLTEIAARLGSSRQSVAAALKHMLERKLKYYP